MNNLRPMHPFTPFNPICIFGDHEIDTVQTQIYYMTSRLREILLHRLDGPHQEQIWTWWNVRFGLEVQLANSLVGWATAVGLSVDIPYLLRSICVFGPYINMEYSFSYTPELEVLLRRLPTVTDSFALRPAKVYYLHWWNEGALEDNALSTATLPLAVILHRTVVRGSTSESSLDIPRPRKGKNKQGDSTVCLKCPKYRSLAQQASAGLKEAVTHLAAVRQYIEWSTANSQRMIQGYHKIANQAEQVNRALEKKDIRQMALGRQESPADPPPSRTNSMDYPQADGAVTFESV
ncbi:hypothetical protein GALMADRAFT_149019 [Galerina marginata CBS 339.88]|uniref:Uncharacterized protein n=1 Tax=Galerina marginata (strain CBS 339.88) TaxID=685588 RepID=A0A067S2M7_GALM3|nr:hypothetical protein GALMADRAFT_149019 [Galerina marginata CBS 339.88]